MKPSNVKPIAIYYLNHVLPKARDIASGFGYALAVHGSMSRDLDLVAIPWTDDAKSAEDLVEAIRAGFNGVIKNDPNAPVGDYINRNPKPKPHGRLAWSIYLGAGPYIDLSVMPRSGGERSDHAV